MGPLQLIELTKAWFSRFREALLKRTSHSHLSRELVMGEQTCLVLPDRGASSHCSRVSMVSQRHHATGLAAVVEVVGGGGLGGDVVVGSVVFPSGAVVLATCEDLTAAQSSQPFALRKRWAVRTRRQRGHSAVQASARPTHLTNPAPHNAARACACVVLAMAAWQRALVRGWVRVEGAVGPSIVVDVGKHLGLTFAAPVPPLDVAVIQLVTAAPARRNSVAANPLDGVAVLGRRCEAEQIARPGYSEHVTRHSRCLELVEKRGPALRVAFTLFTAPHLWFLHVVGGVIESVIIESVTHPRGLGGLVVPFAPPSVERELPLSPFRRVATAPVPTNQAWRRNQGKSAV